MWSTKCPAWWVYTELRREGKFEAGTMMCSRDVHPLSSFDTMSIWETTSLKVTVVSMVTGWIEAREEGGTECSACSRGGGGRRSRTWLPACSSHFTTNNVWFIFWAPLPPSVSPSNQLSLLPPSLGRWSRTQLKRLRDRHYHQHGNLIMSVTVCVHVWIIVSDTSLSGGFFCRYGNRSSGQK